MDLEIFEELGLTKAESQVYVSLLEIGTTSAGKIIEKSSLQNSVLHRSLNSLIEKGFVTFILEGRKKIYQAVNPENFNQILKDRKKRFEKVLPELKQIQNLAEDTTGGRIFKGKRGLSEMYLTLLNSPGEEYNTFGGGSRVSHDVMGNTWWKNLHSKIKSRKIIARQVFDETIRDFGKEISKISKSQIKYLPEEFEQLQETIIRGEYVGIAIFSENPYGILIKDKSVSDGYKKQFEMLWRLAKK